MTVELEGPVVVLWLPVGYLPVAVPCLHRHGPAIHPHVDLYSEAEGVLHADRVDGEITVVSWHVVRLVETHPELVLVGT